MNAAVAIAILLLGACAIFMVPMLPALRELKLKQDAEPLTVIQQYAGDILHFAHGFREHVQRLGPQLAEYVATGIEGTAKLPGGDECLLLGMSSTEEAIPVEGTDRACTRVIIAAGDLALPDAVTFFKEIYVTGKLAGGERASYRAILGEGDIFLGPSSKVMRWVHAGGTLHADRDCDLYGRLSSDREIVIESGCMFQRLKAPRIVVGSGKCKPAGESAAPAAGCGSLSKIAGAVPTPRRIVQGDLDIRAGAVVIGDIVARGKVNVGAGAKVIGSLKSGKRLVLDRGVCVSGSLISAETMRIGEDCRLHGPVIAEREIVVARGTRCGESHASTTVSALRIQAEEGVVVFGTLWARDLGQTVPNR